MNKALFCCLYLVLIPIFCHSQTKFLNVSEKWNGGYIGIDLRQANFINQNYYQNKDSKTIQPKITFGYNYQYRIHPLIIELHYSTCEFDSPTLLKFENKKNIELISYQLNLKLLIFPKTKIISPYTGIGYSKSSLHMNSKASASGYYSSINLDGINFLSGLDIKIKNVIIEIFYNRNFSIVGKNRDYNVLGIGALYSIRSITKKTR